MVPFSANEPLVSPPIPVLCLPTPDDQLVRRLRLPRLVTLRGHAPWRNGVAAARGAAFTAAHRVIHRVHRDAAVVRPPAEPAAAAGLADHDVFMLEIADLSHRAVALLVEDPHLARRELHLRVLPFLGDELAGRSGAAADLAAATRNDLQVVDVRAERDQSQRQRVPHPDFRFRPGFEPVADRESVRGDDVTLLTVRVDEQRDAGRAVRIVLDRVHPGRNAALVTPEIDQAITPPVPASAMPARDMSLVVAAAGVLLRLEQALFRFLLRENRKVRDGLVPETRCQRSEFLDGHWLLPAARLFPAGRPVL